MLTSVILLRFGGSRLGSTEGSAEGIRQLSLQVCWLGQLYSIRLSSFFDYHLDLSYLTWACFSFSDGKCTKRQVETRTQGHSWHTIISPVYHPPKQVTWPSPHSSSFLLMEIIEELQSHWERMAMRSGKDLVMQLPIMQ